jgi:aromatic ring-opening dioxygenase LigB subunit
MELYPHIKSCNGLTLVYACIAPHGSEIIPRLASKSTLRKFQKTRDGLTKLASEVAKAKPDIIVIATPHNLKVWTKIAVITSENSTGTLQASPRNKRSVSLKAKCDADFAQRLLANALKRKLPTVGVNYGTSEGVTSDMPMDWGTLIPLWFILPRCRPKPRVVIVTPSREIPLRQNFLFGRVIGELSDRTARRVVFVASADQAHRHRKGGPYGFSNRFSNRSKEYDKFVIESIKRNQIGSIMSLRGKLVEAARPDSLWQMTMLAGALEARNITPQVLSYDVPTYFGMICASFRIAD